MVARETEKLSGREGAEGKAGEEGRQGTEGRQGRRERGVEGRDGRRGGTDRVRESEGRQGRREVYYVYGFMLLVFLILIIVTVCVTIVGTYFLLNAENYHWQWTSFFSAASTAVYVYLYSIYYYYVKTKMSGGSTETSSAIEVFFDIPEHFHRFVAGDNKFLEEASGDVWGPNNVYRQWLHGEAVVADTIYLSTKYYHDNHFSKHCHTDMLSYMTIYYYYNDYDYDFGFVKPDLAASIEGFLVFGFAFGVSEAARRVEMLG
ncbi:hypothetical protein RJT34_03496 [Clitoria ternatea]|uniref:Transmembrane 9 superfamily member n=1 Tax=Clitoria ternatea TaxID=43366 RepID=A0AAN9KN32_CLITE